MFNRCHMFACSNYKVKQHAKYGPSSRPRIRGPNIDHVYILLSSRQLYYNILLYTILYFTLLYYTILYYTILYYTVL